MNTTTDPNSPATLADAPPVKAAHTPGPWVARDSDTGRAVQTVDIVHRDGYETVAKVFGTTTHLSDGFASANQLISNARLIAAAPDLLAALDALLRQTNNIEVLGEWEAEDINRGLRKTTRAKIDAVIEQSRAAIAKAKGAQ